ncbi:LPS translocon maturation chaperone LptM [Thiocapsa bogorovii]|uniref:LPS translocon maturation chaperone LptM n=1 Tax=Thiocapsa bogorovii TaxID=521689 RepID=UPI001E4672DC|nr:lipoprotein [Thiocapsa bogorovii]UHD14309.1 lipoprotein [Thiocapsa bogorovii]
MNCWAGTAFYLLVTVFGIASMIGACGQKGPLYLPEPPVVEVPASAAEIGSVVPSAAVPPPESTAPPDRP